MRVDGSGRRLLGPLSTRIRAGERVWVIGGRGAGKTSLLHALRGPRLPARGSILWDGRDVAELSAADRDEGSGMLAESVHWSRQRAGSLLDPDRVHSEDAVLELLAELGGKRLRRRLKRGLATKLASHQLSHSERQAVILARLLLCGPSVLLLDQPFDALSPGQRRKAVRALLREAADRTLIATSTSARVPDGFQRVIRLRAGRSSFDGSALEWRRSHSAGTSDFPQSSLSAGAPGRAAVAKEEGSP